MKRRKYKEETIQLVCELYKKGWKAKDISQETGISASYISVIVNRNKLTKYTKVTDKEKAYAIKLYQTHTAKEVSTITNIPEGTISKWYRKTANKPRNVQRKKPETISFHIGRVSRYLVKKHNTLRLTVKQAFEEIGTFKRGSELGEVLYTDRLPTLNVGDIARYIVLYT